MSRWAELIEGDNERLSMRSICTYIIVITLCAGVFICLQDKDGGTAMGLAGILSTLMGIIYGIGKVMDASVTKAGMPSQPQSVNVDNIESVTVGETKKRGKRAF